MSKWQKDLVTEIDQIETFTNLSTHKLVNFLHMKCTKLLLFNKSPMISTK